MKISNSIIVQYITTSNISTITKYYARTAYARVQYAYITTLYTAVWLQTTFRDSWTYRVSPHLTLPPVLDVPYLPHIFQLPINHSFMRAKLQYNAFYMTYIWFSNYYTSIICKHNRCPRLTLTDSFKKCGISNVLNCTLWFQKTTNDVCDSREKI